VYGSGKGDPGPGTFDASLLTAELVIRGIAAGVDGFNKWSFVNRGVTGAQWQLIDTYDSETKSFRRNVVPIRTFTTCMECSLALPQAIGCPGVCG